MQLFIQTHLDKDSQMFAFDKTESRHMTKVLRKKEGDTIHVTNGQGSLFTCILQQVQDKECIAKVVETRQDKPHPYVLHMAVAPTKTNDRYEWFLEKATEIGIDEIIPVLCKHSERKNIRVDRYEKILESALKQSLQTHLPKIHPLTPIEEVLAMSTAYDYVFIAHCEKDAPRLSLKEALVPGKRYLILIGPEGDFSSKEIEKARKHNWREVHLGNTRLRTETAAIVACHSVAFINE